MGHKEEPSCSIQSNASFEWPYDLCTSSHLARLQNVLHSKLSRFETPSGIRQ